MYPIGFLSAVFPRPCPHNCNCHRSPWEKVNIFDCRNKGLKSLLKTVLEDTDRLLLSGNSLGSLTEAPDYLNNITLLNFSSNNIEYIEEKVVKVISKSAMGVDIRGNKLKSLPRAITNMKSSTKLWISDNPYDCNCDTLWMKDWLIDNKNVQDKYNVVCSTGKLNLLELSLPPAKQSCEKVIFSQVSVCHSVQGGSHIRSTIIQDAMDLTIQGTVQSCLLENPLVLTPGGWLLKHV